MIGKESRYTRAVAFRYEDGAPQPFTGIRPRAIGAARPVLEHGLRDGERPDLLAAHYYNDAALWWRLLDANPDVLYAGDLAGRDPTDPLLVPRARDQGNR